MRKLFVICALVGLFYAATRDLCKPAQAESKGREASEQKYIKVLVKRKPADKDWKLRDTRTIELLDSFQPGSKKIPYSKYGGRVDIKAEAKGFFYPKKVAGRWWLVDPDGNLFVHIGVCSVRRGRSRISQKPAKEKFGTWKNGLSLLPRFLQNMALTESADGRMQSFCGQHRNLRHTHFLGISWGRSAGLRSLSGRSRDISDTLTDVFPYFIRILKSFAMNTLSSFQQPKTTHG